VDLLFSHLTTAAASVTQIKKRGELALAGRYDYQVLNDDLDRAVEELVAILARTQPETRTGTHS